MKLTVPETQWRKINELVDLAEQEPACGLLLSITILQHTIGLSRTCAGEKYRMFKTLRALEDKLNRSKPKPKPKLTVVQGANAFRSRPSTALLTLIAPKNARRQA